MEDSKREKLIDISFIVAIVAVALMARICLLPVKSGDFLYCLSVWMERIHDHGAWGSLAYRISNYSAAYMYVMALVSGFKNTLYALKGFSILFDFISAGAVFALVKHLTGNTRRGIAGFAAVLLCPTVIINSAWWCQCDTVYVAFMLLSLLYFLKDKGSLCCIMLGIAFSFKLQAVFLLPFLVVMWAKGRTVKFWHFLWIPAVYFVVQIPAWIAGRPMSELLGVYVNQTGMYPFGTLHYPNMYEFLLQNNHFWKHLKEVSEFGLYFSIGALGMFAYWMVVKKFRLTPQILVTMALFSVCLALFTMPHMHERYGMMVDLLVIVYALQRPEKIPVALCYITLSLLSYSPFLNGYDALPGIWQAIWMFGLNIMLGVDLARQIKENVCTTE